MTNDSVDCYNIIALSLLMIVDFIRFRVEKSSNLYFFILLSDNVVNFHC